jgi:uncharacterized protein (DUF2141 family)
MKLNRRLASLFLISGMLCGLASSARAQSEQNLIHATLVDLPNNTGRIGCIIFNSPDGFPRDHAKATAQARAPIANQAGTCDFKGLPPGTYAIASFHDEFETGKMETNFLGMPQEVYGFSNDARPSALTPPPFSACAFTYSGGVMNITMHAQH